MSSKTKLRIGVALLPQLLPSDWAAGRAVAVVIDTLRFTSTACVALAAGAESIAVMSDIEAARQLASSVRPPMLLCGERHCVRIAGFDMGNSPLEYVPERIGKRQLIFSTTNGTVAVEAARDAHTIVLGSLLNRTSVSRWLGGLDAEGLAVWIVCAGTDGQVAQEDVLTAGAIIDAVADHEPPELLNDSTLLALGVWRQVQRDKSLIEQLRAARGGRNLIESGFEEDVAFVAQVDRLDGLPKWDGRVFRMSSTV